MFSLANQGLHMIFSLNQLTGSNERLTAKCTVAAHSLEVLIGFTSSIEVILAI